MAFRWSSRRPAAEAEAAPRPAEPSPVAPELPGLMAHQLSAIGLRAAVALRQRDPEVAFAALEQILRASGDALREYRSAMGALPLDDDASLDRLPELLDQVRAAGLAVRLTGDVPAGLSPGVALVAYRIVHEALSNALRHSGADEVRIDIRCTDATVTVRVDDDGGPETQRGPGGPGDGVPGTGLSGLAERAQAAGGWLTSGRRAGGGFRVVTELPRHEG